MADTTQLQELQADSGKRLPVSLITGFTQNAHLVLPVELQLAGGRRTAKRSSVPGADLKMRAETRLKKLGSEPGDYIAGQLNDALLGGSDYPILGAVAGTAIGLGTGGAGFLFTIATTALSISKTTRRVLARDGDEIWRVEDWQGHVRRQGPTEVCPRVLPHRSLPGAFAAPQRLAVARGSIRLDWLACESL